MEDGEPMWAWLCGAGVAMLLWSFGLAPSLAASVALVGAPPTSAVGTVPAASPPQWSYSRYMANTDQQRHWDLGCALGDAVSKGLRPLSAVVILDYGSPQKSGSTQGASLFGAGFRSTATIRHAAEQYGAGYHACVGSTAGANLVVAVGTSTYGSNVTSAHGTAWANMVNAANTTWQGNGVSAHAYAIGADDIEPPWGGPSLARSWVGGYDAVNRWSLYDYGGAAGCPPYGDCYGAWTQEDVWYVSWGAPPSFPLPEIYAESGANAQQWYLLSLYGVQHHGGSMGIKGAASQFQACVDVGDDCAGVKNTPGQAWTHLWNALNADSRTAQPLPYSTDFTWID
jgi:hypothetical protein